MTGPGEIVPLDMGHKRLCRSIKRRAPPVTRLKELAVLVPVQPCLQRATMLADIT
jgi:hypothetical protein